MEICFKKKTVTLSIGEFSEFTDRPVAPSGSGRGGGVWRAQIGQVWHAELRKRLEQQDPTASFEVKIAARWPHRQWIFELQGRADQLVPRAQGLTIREIKTVQQPLPAHEPDLRALFPSYFLQLEAYQQLYPLTQNSSPGPIGAELVLVEIQTGMTQTIVLPPPDEGRFLNQLERIHTFVERRRDQLARLRTFAFHPPFPTLRPGQETIREDIEATFAPGRIGLFQAPTGFGKTGAILEFALNRLRSGQSSRLLFLTSKSTGQIQAAAQLHQMLDGQPTVSFLQVRNKGEHCINSVFHCFREVCPYLSNLDERWEESGLARSFASDDSHRIELNFLREEGRRARICPYEITRSVLPLLDIWIGDYNYAFSPSNRGLFVNQPGFDPGQTLLIVDEAHNLPSRVCDTFSARVNVTDALAVMTQLELLGTPAPILLAWEHWLDFLSHLDRCDELPPAVEQDLRQTVVRVCEQLGARPLDYPSLGPDITQQLTELFSIRQLLQADQLERLLWSPRAGQLNLDCIHAGPFIAEILRGFGQVVLMSGTFGPLEAFHQTCGLELTETAALQAHAPWRSHACDVAVDVRVDTRLRSRGAHFGTTAATVATLVEASAQPVVVFFSSYHYAESVRQRIDGDFPWVRIAMQERGVDFQQQASFVEESLLMSDALFLILGSSYAEGIDLLGGRVDCAMVVGPALPEVNALQRARLKRLSHLSSEEAFHEVYQIPGMQRVSQALGRLVRAPAHRAKILLHCQRFADKSYSSLLHPDHRPRTTIFSAEELAQWLANETAPV
jgi:DNA excision repair protein ERCC-2